LRISTICMHWSLKSTINRAYPSGYWLKTIVTSCVFFSAFQWYISRRSVLTLALGLDCTGNTCERPPPCDMTTPSLFIDAFSYPLYLSFVVYHISIGRMSQGLSSFAKRRIDRALHHRPLFRRAANKLIVRHNVSGVDGGVRVKTRGRVPTCARNKCSLYNVIYRFL